MTEKQKQAVQSIKQEIHKPLSDREKLIIALATEFGTIIKLSGGLPSGNLYAGCMAYMDLDTYNAVITFMKELGLIKETNHFLTWIKN